MMASGSPAYCTRSSGKLHERLQIKINAGSKQNTVDLLKSIGPHVKHLEIVEGDNDMNILQTIYREVPAIASLKVSDSYMVQNVNILPENLTKIIIDSEVLCEDLVSLMNLKLHPALKMLQCSVIRINKLWISTNDFMDDELKLKLMSTFAIEEPIDVKTDFNFLDTNKMTLSDINGLKFKSEIQLLQSLLCFKNLQELDLDLSTSCIQNVQDFKHVDFKLPQITVLKLAGNALLTCFQPLFQIFSSLTSLEIRGCHLRNEHLSEICENLIHLKKLYLYGKDTNCFTINVFMSCHLKCEAKDVLGNLKQLEELLIESTSNKPILAAEGLAHDAKQWPLLLKLKYLHLSGHCFSHITEDVLKQMGTRCPNVERFVLDASGGIRPTLNFILIIFDMWGKQLTHLGFKSPKQSYLKVNGLFFWHNFIQKCPNLQYIHVMDLKSHMHISDQHQLFCGLKSLECIEIRTGTETRKMTRNDFCNINAYLAKNFEWYTKKNLRDTIKFVNVELMNRRNISGNRVKELTEVCDFLGITTRQMSVVVVKLYEEIQKRRVASRNRN